MKYLSDDKYCLSLQIESNCNDYKIKKKGLNENV